MRKKLFVLCVTLLLTTSTFILVSNEFEVKATPGGGGEGEWENETSLDYVWIWDATLKLAEVVHKQMWEETNWIRKGRAFGTLGDNWTANYIREILKDNFKRICLANRELFE